MNGYFLIYWERTCGRFILFVMVAGPAVFFLYRQPTMGICVNGIAIMASITLQFLLGRVALMPEYLSLVRGVIRQVIHVTSVNA